MGRVKESEGVALIDIRAANTAYGASNSAYDNVPSDSFGENLGSVAAFTHTVSKCFIATSSHQFLIKVIEMMASRHFASDLTAPLLLHRVIRMPMKERSERSVQVTGWLFFGFQVL